MVDMLPYRIRLLRGSPGPEYKGPWKEIHNTPRVYIPAAKAIQTPNSDTPYLWLGMDLRDEPIVLTMPPIEKERYFSIQLTGRGELRN
jgi:hypothetical protein